MSPASARGVVAAHSVWDPGAEPWGPGPRRAGHVAAKRYRSVGNANNAEPGARSAARTAPRDQRFLIRVLKRVRVPEAPTGRPPALGWTQGGARSSGLSSSRSRCAVSGRDVSTTATTITWAL